MTDTKPTLEQIEHALLRPYPKMVVEQMLVFGAGEATGYVARRAAELVAGGWVDQHALTFTGGIVVNDKPLKVLVDLAALHGISRPNDGETEGDYGARVYCEELKKLNSDAENALRKIGKESDLIWDQRKEARQEGNSELFEALSDKRQQLSDERMVFQKFAERTKGGYRKKEEGADYYDERTDFVNPDFKVENVSINTDENIVEAMKVGFMRPTTYHYDWTPGEFVGDYKGRRLLPQHVGILALPYHLERAMGTLHKRIKEKRLSYRSHTLIVPHAAWLPEIGVTLESWKGVAEPTPIQAQLLPAVQGIIAGEYAKTCVPTMAESPYAKAGFFTSIDHDQQAADIELISTQAGVVYAGGAWSKPLDHALLKVDLNPRRRGREEPGYGGRPSLYALKR